jgi:hypothetical protein
MSLPGPAAVLQCVSVANVATTVTLTRRCRTLQLWTDSGAGDIYVTFDGTVPTVGGATTIKIAGGGAWQSPAGCNMGVDYFKYIGSAASGKLSIFGI